MTQTLIRIGEHTAVVIPPEMLERYGLQRVTNLRMFAQGFSGTRRIIQTPC